MFSAMPPRVLATWNLNGDFLHCSVCGGLFIYLFIFVILHFQLPYRWVFKSELKKM